MSRLHIGQADGKKFEVDLQSLTRHAIILGATGSGKTMLSKAIVEEAALAGITTFAIDPKGDIGNLAFQSPDFDFTKWSAREADALKTDRSIHAKNLQKEYADRAMEFSVSPDAADRFAQVPVRIFTPKSPAGLPVGISPDLSAPADFARLLQQDVSSAADLLDLTSHNLLRLAGYGQDDRKEITFVSALLEDAWKTGQSLTVKDLIRRIEDPPMGTIGTLHVSDVVEEKDRRKLATRINLLISDPKLRSWSAARPLDFAEIFSKPSISVLDLRNIQSEQEKHLFVEMVLQQLYQWLIKQGSAQTLRYLLYFDEIAGYCPPVREPPSKKLLLLLIKQARAFGLGLLLASQNAVDLDYKVISNANVRFIGRLGAQRDIQRVSVGLELGTQAEKEIARLKAGEFFCNIFEPRFRGVIKSRWTLTYHRGPLENSEIAELMAGFKNQEELAAPPKEPVEGEAATTITAAPAAAFEEAAERADEELLLLSPSPPPPQPLQRPADRDPAVAADSDDDRHHTLFMLLEKRYEPKDLSSFIRLGNNVKSLQVLSVEQEERFHPAFELSASVFEKSYAGQSLERVEELAAFGGRLVELPQHQPPHTLVPQRHVPAEARKEAEKWKGEMERRAAELKKELQLKFDVIMEEKRREYVDSKSEKPRAKMAGINADVARLQEALNSDIDAVGDLEKLYKELKKEKAKKSRLITTESRIKAKKQKVVTTRRKIEQLHVDRKALEEKLREIERLEKERFHNALAAVKSRSSHSIEGWLVETVYRARITINGKEHYGDVRWSAYTGEGTWGRCSTCSTALEAGSACACGNLMCNHHLAYCKACLEPVCKDHRSLCYICNSTFCARHSIRCELCGSVACSGHGGTCSVCSRKVCSNCSQKKGILIKRELVCRSCSG